MKFVNNSDKIANVKERQWTKANFKKYILKAIFSHFGLFLLLVLYTVLGAFLFQQCEFDTLAAADKAANAKFAEIEEKRTKLGERFKDIARIGIFNYNTSVTLEEMENWLQEFHTSVADAIQNGGYTGQLTTKPGEKWSFSSASVFALSITTTIGYGNVCPVTDIGRFLVLPYALLGIPFFLIFLTDHGYVIGKVLRFCYMKCCCHGPNKKRETSLEIARLSHLKHLKKKEAEQVVKMKHPIHGEDGYVPISLLLFLVFLFAFLGTLMFWKTENWTLVQSCYFVVVTMFTVGFGDLVPGYNNVGTVGGKVRLVAADLYTVVGLAILSMSIGLAVDELFNKAKKLAANMQFLKEEEELMEEERYL